MGFFPVDQETLEYLKFTNRDADLIALVEAYTKEQGLFRTDATPDPHYAETLDLNLVEVNASMAGPKRPQDRVELHDVRKNFHSAFPAASTAGSGDAVNNGSVVIAAITSCTNTSNPSVMLAAGLLAKKAVARGLQVKPWVKTSLAPGSKVVIDYYREAGLLNPSNSSSSTWWASDAPPASATAAASRRRGGCVQKQNLVVAAVLSGNRNFEGRVNPQVKANYLASPPLVVAYALAGTMDIDLTTQPLGTGRRQAGLPARDLAQQRRSAEYRPRLH
jgi:aconitate hydratase